MKLAASYQKITYINNNSFSPKKWNTDYVDISTQIFQALKKAVNRSVDCICIVIFKHSSTQNTDNKIVTNMTTML
jgi:hypothetical protein